MKHIIYSILFFSTTLSAMEKPAKPRFLQVPPNSPVISPEKAKALDTERKKLQSRACSRAEALQERLEQLRKLAEAQKS